MWVIWCFLGAKFVGGMDVPSLKFLCNLNEKEMAIELKCWYDNSFNSNVNYDVLQNQLHEMLVCQQLFLYVAMKLEIIDIP